MSRTPKTAQQPWETVPKAAAPPDFANFLAVMNRTAPDRPTLFELFLNGPLYERFSGETMTGADMLADLMVRVKGFRNAGYDYATINVPGFDFASGELHEESTRSLNEGAVICDRESFDRYDWPNPEDADCEVLQKLGEHTPAGMKLLVLGPMGVLENVIKLVGYENLCYLTVDDPTLVSDIFEAVGSRLVQFYRLVAPYDAVGALIGNDDWGFKSQTMLPPEQMRQLVFPWHKQIVETAHAADKPALLHSCGCLTTVMDDIVDDMGYDAKHSYEDTIQPVEDAYDEYHDRIAILGGIDVDFVCRASPEKVYERSARMLDRTENDGAYALGTGNSVPEYVPDDHYFAMIRAALDRRG